MPQDHIARFNEGSRTHQEELNGNLRFAGGESTFFYQAKIRLIRERVSPAPGVILDYGCGVGTLTAMLAEAFPAARVIGYDPAAAGIDVAREEHTGAGDRLTFQSELDPEEIQADLVVAAGVFHHIPPEAKRSAVSAAYRSLRPGGRFFVFEHNPLSPLTRIIVANAKVDEGATLSYPWQMTEMMRTGGFREVETDFISFFPPFMGPLLRLEPYLTKLPISAQYLAMARRT